MVRILKRSHETTAAQAIHESPAEILVICRISHRSILESPLMLAGNLGLVGLFLLLDHPQRHTAQNFRDVLVS